MPKHTQLSCKEPIFHDRILPEKGSIVGYAAIIHTMELAVPLPLQLSLVCDYNKKYQTDDWLVFPKNYMPDESRIENEIEALYKHLVFALKYEGVNLLVFSYLIKKYDKRQLTQLVNIEPTGKYSRKIWFLIEWLMGTKLPGKEDLPKKSYVKLLDEKLQFGISGYNSFRHRVINNLPGNIDFCPLIRKTPKLEKYLNSDIFKNKRTYLKGIHKDILRRASAFLLLKDSKASFTIEGESVKNQRAVRWGQAIGQAGTRNLSKDELLRLQHIIIGSSRFTQMGFRQQGGFVGEHDRISGEPIPDHISAKAQDIDKLIGGLIKTYYILLNEEFDPVLAASVISFGFVFIHPFVDGNGRIHRYLIHHVLAKKKFTEQGFIFPVSASMLNHIEDYRNCLEKYSHVLLDLINWKETEDHNVEVIGDTADYYKYFDATAQAEFLYECVNDTLKNIIPAEIEYLIKYDEFKQYIENKFEMPDKMISLLVRFLDQNNGKLSKRALTNEFAELSNDEIIEIQKQYKSIFD